MRQLRTVVVAFLLVILLSSSMVGVAQAGSKKDPCAKKKPRPSARCPRCRGRSSFPSPVSPSPASTTSPTVAGTPGTRRRGPSFDVRAVTARDMMPL